MSEFLEKLEQPELIVTSSAKLGSAENSSCAGASSCATTASSAGSSASSGTCLASSADSPGSEPAKTSADSNDDRLISSTDHENPSDEIAVSNSISTFAPKALVAKDQSNPSTKPTKGIVRHRAITGCCMTLSLAVLSLCAFDIRGLIDKEGSLDPNFKFTPVEKKISELPLHYRYYDSPSPSYSEGLSRIADNTTDAIGFADEKGSIVLPAIYSEAKDFHDGLAAVKFREKDPRTGVDIKPELQQWAFINKQGETVLKPAYYDVGQFNNGVAPVGFEGHGILINKKGETIATSNTFTVPRQFGDLFEMDGKGFKRGLMNASGKFVVPPIYDHVEKMDQLVETKKRLFRHQRNLNKYVASNQYFKVFKDGKCGLVDNTGELLIPIQYNEISSYNKGHAVVQSNFRWGLVNGNNNFIIEPNYEFVSIYDDIIATREQGKWKVFDSHGKLLNTKIDGAMVDTTSPWVWDGMAAVVVGDKCGFINSKGDFVVKPNYDLVQHFSNGKGLVLNNGTWKFVDTNGAIASSKTFAEAAPFADGKAPVTLAGPLFDFVNLSQIENRKYDYERTRTDAKDGQGHN